MSDHPSESSSKAEKKMKQVIQEENTSSTVWIQILDGSVLEIDQEDAILCPKTKAGLDSGHGFSKNNPISLALVVEANCVTSAFGYWRSLLACSSKEEHKPYINSFVQMDAKCLADLILVANCLQLELLSKCTNDAMSYKMRNTSTEEIYQSFNFSDDFTEESQNYPPDDPRARLLSKMYRKKGLRSAENVKNTLGGVTACQHHDTRNVDDLVSFIRGGNGDTKEVQTSKKKKKNRRRGRGQNKTSSSTASSSSGSSTSKKVNVNNDEDPNASAAGVAVADDSELLGTQDENFSSDLDSDLNEELNREVEEFARKLNTDIGELYS